MKQLLSLLIRYILLNSFATIFFAGLFMFSCGMIQFVPGEPFSFFSKPFFMYGIFYSFPLACICSHILLVLYAIRYPDSIFSTLAAYILLGALSWLVLIPADVKKLASEPALNVVQTGNSSAGFFRKTEDGIYYLSRVDDSGNADGIFINVSGVSGQAGTVIQFSDTKIETDFALPYSDPLIKEAVQPTAFIMYPLSAYNTMLEAAQKRVSAGYAEWVCFASFGLALLSVFAVRFFTLWKLASAVAAIVCAMGIFFMNYLYYAEQIPLFIVHFSDSISKILPMNEPFLFFLNNCIACMFILLGVFTGIFRTRKKTTPENEK